MKDSNSMKIKSYFAKSVDEAIAKARVELGSEALLLNTRKLPDAGGYEVVMGVTGAASAPQIPPTAPPPRAITKSPMGHVRPTEVGAEMKKLRAQMDELQSLLVRSARNSWSAQRSVPEIADVYDRLIAADVDPALSKDIADRLEAGMATDAFFLYTGPEAEGAQNRWKPLKSDPARVGTFLRAELESRVILRPRLGVNGAKGAVAAFVGPAGSGKTTSLAKLAVAASAQRPVRLVSLDTSNVQLLSSLAISGIAFSAVDSTEKLPELVADARKKECVLIDTPGNIKEQEPLAAALAACGDVDIHLVAPAYMRARDLRNSIERFRILQPSKLLITHMDETTTFGTVFSEAAMAGLALSFLSHGPRIPEDIRAATVDDLWAMAEERPRTRAHAAGSNRAA